MEKEIASEKVRVTPTTKSRLDRLGGKPDHYEDIIYRLLNFFEAGNNPPLIKEVEIISTRFKIEYRQAYWMYMEFRGNVEHVEAKILEIKRNEAMLKEKAGNKELTHDKC